MNNYGLMSTIFWMNKTRKNILTKLSDSDRASVSGKNTSFFFPPPLLNERTTYTFDTSRFAKSWLWAVLLNVCLEIEEWKARVCETLLKAVKTDSVCVSEEEQITRANGSDWNARIKFRPQIL